MLTLLLTVLLAPQGVPFQDNAKQDALSYEIELDVQMPERRLAGQVRYRFQAVEALQTIELDGRKSDDWVVTFHDEAGAELATRWEEDHIAIDLGRLVEAADELTFTAKLAGKPVDGFQFKDNRYGEAMAFTDHYSIRARGWLPCEDNPADRARFRLRVTFPEELRIMCSGQPAPGSPTVTDGRTTFESETVSDIPPYMFAIVLGPFAEVVETGHPALRPHLVYRQDVDKAKRALVHHAKWLTIMEEHFGPYPYSKYAVVQCPTRWGGFEAPGNVLLSERIFDMPSGGAETMAHELTHMWFGDGVGYAQWVDVWLAEGFASYFGPWLHAQTGGPPLVERLVELRERWRDSREGLTHEVRWSKFKHPDLALNANTYPKGAWVLHMLRVELGDELFFAAIREFFTRNQGTSVRTTEFTQAVEKATGSDMGWFFGQWLDRPNCPRLEVHAYKDTIIVKQAQNGRRYRFRLKLRFVDATGVTQVRVYEIMRARTDIKVENGPVTNIEIDPEVELLYRKAQ